LSELKRVENFQPLLEIVENRFYGSSIGITGLLTGQDIYHHLSSVKLGDRVFLPGNCLKDEHLFLDDWTIEDLSSRLQRPVIPLDNDFNSLFGHLADQQVVSATISQEQ
jgi:NifB/MoaA-like Fe-S oxidoreductase